MKTAFFFGLSADRLELPLQNGCSIWNRKWNRIIHVMPAEAGIQRLKSLDPGQKHAGMTIQWDSNGSDPLLHVLVNLLIRAFNNKGFLYSARRRGTVDV